MRKFALLGTLALALGAPAFASSLSPQLPSIPTPSATPEPDQDCPDQGDGDQDQDDKQLVQCFAKTVQGTVFHKIGHFPHKTQWQVLNMCRHTSHMECVALGCHPWNPASAE